mgnify:CR=1 FL=1
MTLDQFLSLAETHTISPDEAQSLNMSLSKASVDDIPEQQRGVVLDYRKRCAAPTFLVSL